MSIEPSIITCYSKLNKEVNLPSLYILVQSDVEDQIVSKTNNVCIERYATEPGKILSVGYEKYVKGCRRPGTSSFRNSVSIIITSGVNQFVYVKVFTDTIHVCGSKSVEESTLTCKLLRSRIIEINEILDWCRSNPMQFEAGLNEIYKRVKGNVVNISEFKKMKRTLENHDGTYHDIKRGIKVKSSLPPKVHNYVVSHLERIEMAEELKIFFKEIIDNPDQFTIVPPEPKLFIVPMINFNYFLDVEIDRKKFFKEIKKYPEFICNGDVKKNTAIKLCLPSIFLTTPLLRDDMLSADQKDKMEQYTLKIHKDDRIRRKFKKSDPESFSRHIFLLYKSGKITQSSNTNREKSNQAYEKFRKLIVSMEANVRDKSKK